MYSPQKAGLIINACAVLHNILILKGVPLPSEDEIMSEIEESADNEDYPLNSDPARILNAGRQIRTDIANNFFNTSR